MDISEYLTIGDRQIRVYSSKTELWDIGDGAVYNGELINPRLKDYAHSHPATFLVNKEYCS